MFDGAEALDLDADDVAVPQKPAWRTGHADAGGRSGGDDVTRLKGERRRMNAMSSATPNTMLAVVPSCISSPDSQVRIDERLRVGTSSAVVIHGPQGANVSAPLARTHCGSLGCTSRALTSFITA